MRSISPVERERERAFSVGQAAVPRRAESYTTHTCKIWATTYEKKKDYLILYDKVRTIHHPHTVMIKMMMYRILLHSCVLLL